MGLEAAYAGIAFEAREPSENATAPSFAENGIAGGTAGFVGIIRMRLW